MKQPAPDVTSADIERIIRRDFPSGVHAAVRTVLEQYGSDAFEREVDRLRLVCLKLASGDLEALRLEVSRAKLDYRDTLCAAEYPYHSRRMTWRNREDEEKAMQRDWKQYEDWLRR
jgi:hypothetical protein